MLDNPDNLNELHIITFKQQIMYAMQIAYGLVSHYFRFFLLIIFRNICRLAGSFTETSLPET